ncbi:acyltransferase family protein [Sphingobacterium lactis]|uniref:acyltransferase family protein n=1 Tax=Sphingobacterium lactis TaxID=797291 RepID=UPI003F7FADD0
MNLKYIDSIRGIAILMVISTHVIASFQNINPISYFLSIYGQMGVQLFFIASAFTLCLSFENRKNEKHKNWNYVIRRFFRIAPGYYFAIFLYTIYTYFNQHYTFQQIAEIEWRAIIINLFFLNGYFPSVLSKIVPGGWSISTEMSFYLIFPFIFSFYQKYKFTLFNLLIKLLLAIILSQLAVVILGRFGYEMSNNSFVYFNIINQFPVFIIGISYYFLLKQYNFKYSFWIDVLLFILFTILSITLWSLKIDYLFSVIPITSAISFVFLMEIMRKSDQININLLGKIGRASYSMYLFHFLVIDLVDYSFKKLGLSFNNINFFIFYILVAGITYFIGNLSLNTLERYGINFGKKLLRK